MADRLIHAAPKLSKIVALFGSVADGERLAAVLAADRMLEAAGLGWSDVATAIADLGAQPKARAPRATPRKPRRTRRQAYEPQGWADLARFCLLNSEHLNERSHSFLLHMRDSLRRGRQPTDKQSAWLRSCLEQVNRNSDHAART